MSINIKLEGFEELLANIEKAGGSIDSAAEQCLKTSAGIMEEALKTEMHNANVDSDLINRMPPPQIERAGNAITARVGYKKGAYNPNDISDGYEVIFVNYGTPKRKQSQIAARGFIAKAKKNASKKIKKLQETKLKEILRGLNGQ